MPTFEVCFEKKVRIVVRAQSMDEARSAADRFDVDDLEEDDGWQTRIYPDNDTPAYAVVDGQIVDIEEADEEEMAEAEADPLHVLHETLEFCIVKACNILRVVPECDAIDPSRVGTGVGDGR